ncbi:MAG TPA: hypothetical protein VFI61_01300 [Patescibacteria group bacterium]|nr:hypothetical protein [Patescibacteria group bacterium]
MKKLIWFTAIFVLFLVFIVPGILALGIKLIPNGDQPGYDSNRRLSIYGVRAVSQKFVSDKNNLSAVGTSLRNPNLKNKKNIIFNLYDLNNNLIRTSILNGQNVQDGDFTKFVFDPIKDSKDKVYIFNISSPETGPEETTEVFYGQDMPAWIVEYIYDEKIHTGGIPIVLYTKPNSKFEVIKEIYSNWLSRLLHLNSQR